MTGIDPIVLMIVLGMLALLPVAAVMTTAFLKIAVVLAILRNALGIQQVPPNMALYGLALILSAYVMAPVITEVGAALQEPATASAPAQDGAGQIRHVMDAVSRGAEPMRRFMLKVSKPEQREFFVGSARTLWGDKQAAGLTEDNFLVLIPAFVVTELTSAFQVGFLLYLPFIIIDLIVSNVLLAMGMMMVSPITLSIPLKLFLFVMVDGWTRLIQGMILSYT